MDFETADLADLGRFIASRTAYTDAAAIGRSTAPELRYDAVVSVVVRDPQMRRQFTPDELEALVGRMTDDTKRDGTRRRLDAVVRRASAQTTAGTVTVVTMDGSDPGPVAQRAAALIEGVHAGGEWLATKEKRQMNCPICGRKLKRLHSWDVNGIRSIGYSCAKHGSFRASGGKIHHEERGWRHREWPIAECEEE